MEENKNPTEEEEIPLKQAERNKGQMEDVENEVPTPPKSEGGGGGWGWGFSPLSVFSDLQKAAEEISRNAAVVAEKAAKSFEDMQNTGEEDSDSSKEEEANESATDKAKEDNEEEKLRKSALEKLENASDDSILGQGLKVLDDSVENFASGAWKALGSAWREGSNLVQKFENSAVNFAESIQPSGSPVAAGSGPPSILEKGKALSAKGMQVLEYVGKETMDLLISETGIKLEKNRGSSDHEGDEDQYEEVTFDRCFYIYGGPEQLEELEALSNHYALLFNRRKTKLSSEDKSMYDGKLKQIQQIFSVSTGMDENAIESDKGKKIETGADGSDDEMKTLHDSSVSKAADMAAGFTNALTGQNVNDMIQRTIGRLESVHSEGIHRVSEMCCFAVSQLLTLGKSIISIANKVQDEDLDALKIDWPEDSIEKAKLIRMKAQIMTGYVEHVSNSFITGISDVTEAYLAAIKGATADSNEGPPNASIHEKASTFSDHLRTDQTTAMGKIQDGLQYLSYVVLSTSMPTA